MFSIISLLLKLKDNILTCLLIATICVAGWLLVLDFQQGNEIRKANDAKIKELSAERDKLYVRLNLLNQQIDLINSSVAEAESKELIIRGLYDKQTKLAASLRKRIEATNVINGSFLLPLYPTIPADVTSVPEISRDANPIQVNARYSATSTQDVFREFVQQCLILENNCHQGAAYYESAITLNNRAVDMINDMRK